MLRKHGRQLDKAKKRRARPFGQGTPQTPPRIEYDRRWMGIAGMIIVSALVIWIGGIGAFWIAVFLAALIFVFMRSAG